MTIDVSINVDSNKSISIWGNKILNIPDKIFISDKNGNVTFPIDKKAYSSVEDIYEEQIFYHYKDDGKKKLLRTHHTFIIGKHVDAPTPIATTFLADKEPIIVKTTAPIKSIDQHIGNVTDDKLSDLTIRRVKILDTVLEENTEDLNDSESYNMPLINNKQFSRPLEAILDDRFFGTKINHDIVYENGVQYGNLAKF
jgi:hypothetical protein